MEYRRVNVRPHSHVHLGSGLTTISPAGPVFFLISPGIVLVVAAAVNPRTANRGLLYAESWYRPETIQANFTIIRWHSIIPQYHQQGVAQLVARQVRDVEVPSSSLGTPTTSLIRKNQQTSIMAERVATGRPQGIVAPRRDYVHVVIPMFVQW